MWGRACRDNSTDELGLSMKIRGLTLIRPWGVAVDHLGKSIENRTWDCYLDVGDYIAIHYGKSWDKTAVGFIETATGQTHPDLTKDKVPHSAIASVARFGGNVRDSESPWFVGPVGWLLEDITPIDFVSCKGRQGLWPLPDDVLQQVRANYQLAKRKPLKVAA